MLRRKMSCLVLSVTALGVLSLSGCGPSGGPKVVKGKFKATYEDGTAIPPMSILSLVPEAGGTDYKVGAITSGDGEYSLSTNYQETTLDGAPAGKYKVVVRGGMAPPGGKAATPHPDCADEKTTKLTLEVAESGTVSPNPLKVPLAK
jgi:hypothetical protein